jgi:hypothetical protein
VYSVVILCTLNRNWKISTNFSKTVNMNSTKIRPVRVVLFSAERQTRHDNANIRFRNCSAADLKLRWNLPVSLNFKAGHNGIFLNFWAQDSVGRYASTSYFDLGFFCRVDMSSNEEYSVLHITHAIQPFNPSNTVVTIHTTNFNTNSNTNLRQTIFCSPSRKWS